ncbi:MAG: hypothetical protein Q8K37_05430 [Alphaproteobacteria bacterium]|nr:hypothetical protein [Alphaproteobacteria bacterium]
MFQKKNIIPAILVLSALFLFTYVNRIAEKNSVVITLNYIFIISSIIIFIFYALKIQQKETATEERKEYLKKAIEKGCFYFIIIAGTAFGVSFSLAMIALEYIKNPAINFPFFEFTRIWTGYVWAVIMWIYMKREYNKMQ